MQSMSNKNNALIRSGALCYNRAHGGCVLPLTDDCAVNDVNSSNELYAVLSQIKRVPVYVVVRVPVLYFSVSCRTTTSAWGFVPQRMGVPLIEIKSSRKMEVVLTVLSHELFCLLQGGRRTTYV